jgi:hypothetical protein
MKKTFLLLNLLIVILIFSTVVSAEKKGAVRGEIKTFLRWDYSWDPTGEGPVVYATPVLTDEVVGRIIANIDEDGQLIVNVSFEDSFPETEHIVNIFGENIVPRQPNYLARKIVTTNGEGRATTQIKIPIDDLDEAEYFPISVDITDIEDTIIFSGLDAEDTVTPFRIPGVFEITVPALLVPVK